MSGVKGGFILDERSGLGESVSISVQYTAQSNLGVAPDGLDVVAYFKNVPFLVYKRTYKVLGTLGAWNALLAEAEASYKEYARTETGTLIESVNGGGGLVIMGGTRYVAGSYTESTYKGELANISGGGELNALESMSFNVPVGGHWEGSEEKGKIYFSQPAFGAQAQKTFIGGEMPAYTAGGSATIAGVEGIITSVNRSNPRYMAGADGSKCYDYSVSVAAQRGTGVGGS